LKSLFASRVFARDLLLPLLFAVPLLVALQHYDADLTISRWFFDKATQQFPLKNDWWLQHIWHDQAKRAVTAFACLLLLGAALSSFYRPLRPYRQTLLLVLISMALTTSVVALIKHYSYPACPYQLQVFGGEMLRTSIFDAIADGTIPGHCWPGGHGSTAFSLFCLYFAARSHGKLRLARGLLAFVLLFGLVLSAAQVMRGMHFPSHQVWSALICWYITVLIYWLKTLSDHAMTRERPRDMFAHQRGGMVHAFAQRRDHFR
jgi:membrane-associated PAP2 superfamily phosphatase